MAEKLRNFVLRAREHKRQGIVLTASMGISPGPRTPTYARVLLQNATSRWPRQEPGNTIVSITTDLNEKAYEF
jgi:hypothetical protein